MSGEELSSESSHDHHFPGQYDFIITPGPRNEENAEHIPKNVDYTFSPKLNRLFVKRQAVCPFAIFTSGVPPLYSKIKIIVYSEDNEPVRRCRAHTEGAKCYDMAFISPLHYMRSENALATYHCCEKTGHLSIELPFIKPEDVAEGVENLTFFCSSKKCINKDLFIKFSLIDGSGVVLGHHYFGLHVCSTPGRDRQNHEEGNVRRKRKLDMPSGSDCTQKPKVPHLQQPNEVFKVVMKKRWIHDWLALINRRFELMDAIPIDIQEKYLKKYYAEPSCTGSTFSTSAAARASADVPSTSSDSRYTLRRILVRS